MNLVPLNLLKLYAIIRWEKSVEFFLAVLTVHMASLLEFPRGRRIAALVTGEKCWVVTFSEKPSTVEMNQVHTSSYNPGTVFIKATIWPRTQAPPTKPLPKKNPTKKLNWINCSVSMRKGFLAPFRGHCPWLRLPYIYKCSPYGRNQSAARFPQFRSCSVATSQIMTPGRQGPCPPEPTCPPPGPPRSHGTTFSHRKLPKTRTALERKRKAEHRSRGWGEGPPRKLSAGRPEVKWSEVKSLSRVRLFATPWTVVYQAPPSMGVSRQQCWSGLTFPSPADLPHPGTEPRSPT